MTDTVVSPQIDQSSKNAQLFDTDLNPTSEALPTNSVKLSIELARDALKAAGASGSKQAPDTSNYTTRFYAMRSGWRPKE
jgi:hypothetical protein